MGNKSGANSLRTHFGKMELMRLALLVDFPQKHVGRLFAILESTSQKRLHAIAPAKVTLNDFRWLLYVVQNGEMKENDEDEVELTEEQKAKQANREMLRRFKNEENEEDEIYNR